MSDKLTILTIKEFKKRFQGATNSSDYGNILLRKQFVPDVVKQEGEDEDRTLLFTISTDSVDRDNDTISVKGWKLANFKKNPVVLFAHDARTPPIATATRVFTEDGRLKSAAKFLPPDLADHDHVRFADMIFQMLKHKFMRATSVGFRPIEIKEPEEERGSGFMSGLDFTKQELLEYSIVPVPANPEALQEARSIGIDVKPYKAWMEHVLDDWAEYKNLVLIPKREAEKLYKKAEDSSRIIVSSRKRFTDEDGKDYEVDEDTKEKLRDGDVKLTIEEKEKIAELWMDGKQFNEMSKELDIGESVIADYVDELLDEKTVESKSNEDENKDPELEKATDSLEDELLKEVLSAAVDGEVETIEIQSVSGRKSQWKDYDEFENWCVEEGFDVGTLVETKNFWLFRQKDAGDFEELDVIGILPKDVPAIGPECRVQAVGGKLKTGDNPMEKSETEVKETQPVAEDSEVKELKAIIAKLTERVDALSEEQTPDEEFDREAVAEISENLKEIVDKAGRVLSGKNEESLRRAASLLDDVLVQLDTDTGNEDADDAKEVKAETKEQTNGSKVDVMKEVAKQLDALRSDPEALNAAIAEAVKSGVNAARGRLDA